MKPCIYRKAEEDGRIVCEKIVFGDNQVDPNLCRACPVAAINCAHLRFTLEKLESATILVRYGNGRSEVWPGEPARVSLSHGACAARVIPVEGPRTCAGCALRRPMVVPERVAAQVAAVQPAPSAGQAVRGRIIPFPQRAATAG